MPLVGFFDNGSYAILPFQGGGHYCAHKLETDSTAPLMYRGWVSFPGFGGRKSEISPTRVVSSANVNIFTDSVCDIQSFVDRE